jgi:hypothetical protein
VLFQIAPRLTKLGAVVGPAEGFDRSHPVAAFYCTQDVSDGRVADHATTAAEVPLLSTWEFIRGSFLDNLFPLI